MFLSQCSQFNNRVKSYLIASGSIALLCCAAWGDEKIKEPIKLPIIIAHRGASGYLPEHTLAAYEKAIRQGADYIEPDLVSTKDGVLIARHEPEISETTDVIKKFPDRIKTRKVDGASVKGYFANDFTLKEIKTLLAKERLSFRNQKNNGKYQVATFEEILDLVKRMEGETGRRIGIFPELKHPTYFKELGIPLEDSFVSLINRYGYRLKTDPIYVQCFELATLKYLRSKTKVKLIFLLDSPHLRPYDFVVSGDKRTYLELLAEKDLKEIAATIDAIGPHKRYILPANKNGQLTKPTEFIKRAHSMGLEVHTYTFRLEKQFLDKKYQGNLDTEILEFLKLGVDGVFTDFPDIGVRAKLAYLSNLEIGANPK